MWNLSDLLKQWKRRIDIDLSAFVILAPISTIHFVIAQQSLFETLYIIH